MSFLITPNGRKFINESDNIQENSDLPFWREFEEPKADAASPFLFHSDRVSLERKFETHASQLAKEYRKAGLHETAQQMEDLASEHARHAVHHTMERKRLEKEILAKKQNKKG